MSTFKQSVKNVVIAADEKDRKKMIALCLLLVVEQLDDFAKNIHIREERRSLGYEKKVVIRSLNQEQVGAIISDGRPLLLFPLFFLIRSDVFKSPEYDDLAYIAVCLSQITDNCIKDSKREADLLADIRKRLDKYLTE